MLSGIGKRFSYANVVVTLALVFAMSGGAYAAGKYVVVSTKQISPKVLKQLSGKVGPTGKTGPGGPAGSPGPGGPTGSTGPTGPAGAKGEAGVEGKAGTNGESASVKKLDETVSQCNKLGGSEFKVGGGPPSYACNGASAYKPLPAGKTETGVWGISTHKAGPVRQAFSFPIPLSAPISEDQIEVIKPKEEGKEHAEECPGTLENPEAKAGYLCLYSELLETESVGDAATRSSGVILVFFINSEVTTGFGTSAEGTWAVTAPEA